MGHSGGAFRQDEYEQVGRNSPQPNGAQTNAGEATLLGSMAQRFLDSLAEESAASFEARILNQAAQTIKARGIHVMAGKPRDMAIKIKKQAEMS
jgi:hypothetical protein